MPDTTMPVFNQPQGIPALSPVQQYPTPYGTSQGGGTGGLVDRNKIINDSVQNAINQTQQLQRMKRDQQSYEDQQKFAKGDQNAANLNGLPGAPPQQSFTDSLMHGLSALGSGIKSIFGGGIPAGPDPNAAGGQQVGPPSSAAPPPTLQGPPAPQGPPMVAQAQMDGGVVTPQGTAPQFMKPQPTVLAFQNGGAIPSGFGVRDGGTPGIRGYEDGGAIDPNAGPDAGPTQMHPAQAQTELADIVDKLHGDMHAHALGDDDQPNHSRAIPVETISPREAQLRQQSGGSLADGSAAPQAAMVDQGAPPSAAPPAAAAPQGAGPQAGPQAGAPSAQGASPAVAASASAVQAVQNAPASDPAKTGQQVTSPGAEGKPHSITQEKWDDWDQRIDKAVGLAALAGHDPGQVRQALEANRNAYIQGHVLRYLSSANVALQNGDQKGVEAAMRNAYYYMPDGQDLTVQKDKDGNLVYQDPIDPYKIDNNNRKQPNMIPVDAMHLQLLGQAMLDPMNVQKTLQGVISARATAFKEMAQGRAAGVTAEGNLRKGTGIEYEGEAHKERVSSQNYKDLAEGDAARVRATAYANHVQNIFHQNKIDPQLIKGSQDAAAAFEDAAQGQKTTIEGDPTQNPNVGKTTRDPKKSSVPGATPADIVSGKALASDIFAGGGGSVTPQRAAQLATLAHVAKRSNHPGKDGKPVADFQTDPKTGDTHVWNRATKQWEAFKLPLTSAAAAASGSIGVTADDLDQAARGEQAAAGPGGQSGIPTQSPQMAGALSEGDMQDQDVSG